MNQKRLYLASEFIRTATYNMLANLRYYKSKKKDVMAEHMDTRFRPCSNKYINAKAIDELMGIEGNCRNIYYDSFDNLSKGWL